MVSASSRQSVEFQKEALNMAICYLKYHIENIENSLVIFLIFYQVLRRETHGVSNEKRHLQGN